MGLFRNSGTEEKDNDCGFHDWGDVESDLNRSHIHNWYVYSGFACDYSIISGRTDVESAIVEIEIEQTCVCEHEGCEQKDFRGRTYLDFPTEAGMMRRSDADALGSYIEENWDEIEEYIEEFEVEDD